MHRAAGRVSYSSNFSESTFLTGVCAASSVSLTALGRNTRLKGNFMTAVIPGHMAQAYPGTRLAVKRT